MWSNYVLCKLHNRDIYIVSTQNLKLRIKLHEKGEVKSTKPYLPVTLKAYIAVQTEHLARKLEKYFKSGSGKAIAKKRFLDIRKD